MDTRRFFKTEPSPACNPAYIIQGDCYRFSMMSEKMLRIEYDPQGLFEDRATQTVWNRKLNGCAFTVHETPETLEIKTESYIVHYQKGPFSPHSLYIDAMNSYTNYGGRWRYGQTRYGDPPRHHNLLGTARTLDKLDGESKLGFGLMDKSGHALLDDSTGMILDEKGHLLPRREGVTDLYYIVCGHDYAGTLEAFYRISGAPPVLPRWALGNWWSRYHAYTAESYENLMDRFEKEDIPFTVALVDMDWHITDVPKDCGGGWTGYTWNKALFPNPAAFLQALHKRGLHTALNLHPADGIQPCEEAYPAVARRMDIDPATRFPVPFDCTNESFMAAYCEEVLHPLEEMGVDFWWIDWQQGKYSAREGLDPLWLLNHHLFLDNAARHGRGMILSRYAGPGTHRYPLGFSGDTVSSWASLHFQPYFTATAANIGYGCWSHDIGGFKAGIRDRELYLRWLQFGVFSPILRLHSTNNPFSTKEPWQFDEETKKIASEQLRLRHRLIPYLYTMNHISHTRLRAFTHPMYYSYPETEEAYTVPNQYFFGTELMVCAITEPCDKHTLLASTRAWIPPGIWTDFFTGKSYSGPREAVLCRPLNRQAVLARPGAIVPIDGRRKQRNSADNPDALDILVFPGASNTFNLYEDNGQDFGKEAYTCISLEWKKGTALLTIHVTGDTMLIPPQRRMRIILRGIGGAEISSEHAFEKQADAQTRSLIVDLGVVSPNEEVTIRLNAVDMVDPIPLTERVFDFLNAAQLSIPLKIAIWKLYKEQQPKETIISTLQAMQPGKALMDALIEMTLE